MMMGWVVVMMLVSGMSQRLCHMMFRRRKLLFQRYLPMN